MDLIFDCFFDETFARLERSGLQARKKRNDVIDHLNAVISGCCQGHNVEPSEGGGIAVQSAIKYHRVKKTVNGNVCLMGKYHNVLYIALKIAWDWGVKDSRIIGDLLEEIYSCEKTFERIFLGAIFGTNAPYFIAGWRSDFKDQDENARAMVFYLEHATTVSCKFPVYLNDSDGSRMLRFIDVPIESCGRSAPVRVAVQANAPDILLILLRYGANPVPYDDGNSIVLAICDKLMEMRSQGYPYQLESCLKILMRTIPFIELPYKPHIYEIRRELFTTKYQNLIADNIIQCWMVFGVTSLKHLCRCAIREQLRVNDQLPRGINTLNVPKSLKRYIDLMEE